MEDALFLKKLGLNIKRLRQSKGLTQVELGDLCNSEKSSINRIESGRTNPTATTLKRIADTLQIQLHEIFLFEEKKKG